LQILIITTGNYAFFNWLTIALCLFLFDDKLLGRILPEKLMAIAVRPDREFVPARVRRVVALSMALLIGTISSLFFIQTIRGDLPAGARGLVSFFAPFGISS